MKKIKNEPTSDHRRGDLIDEIGCAVIMQAIQDVQVELHQLALLLGKYGHTCASKWFRSARRYLEAVEYLNTKDNDYIGESMRKKIVKDVERYRDNYIHNVLGLNAEERERINLWIHECVYHQRICRFKDCEKCEELRLKLLEARTSERKNSNYEKAYVTRHDSRSDFTVDRSGGKTDRKNRSNTNTDTKTDL